MPLDDIALLLAQLEATDIVELTQVRTTLVSLTAEDRTPLASLPHLVRAASIIGAIVDGTAPDVDAALRDLHRCIDAARSGSHPTIAPPVSHDRLADDADRELLGDFILESREGIASAETALLRLEDNPADHEAINTVFRAFHTVKGTAAFLDLTRLSVFAHEAESLLSRVRDGSIAYSHGCADLALRGVDMLTLLLQSVESALAGDGALQLPDGYDALIEALSGYEPTRDRPVATSQLRTVIPSSSSSSSSSSSAPSPSPVSASASVSAPVPAPAVDSSRETASDSTIRIRTDRLDRLIDVVGELVIAQAMIAGDETLDAGRHYDLQRKVSHAGKMVRELQGLSMSMRMVPLRPTFQKLARVVRDTAVKAGKQVQWITDGDDIEIDRNLVDILGDPLVHMTRNSVDHGIEPPAVRARLGKPMVGTIRLSAYHVSGHVVVELSDDGGGLHRDRIVAKAIEHGLIVSEQGMSEAEIFALIFAPGFSTAEKVTDISGRGVGMDVVRRNLEAIRGRIDIASTAGEGTTFSIRLPLTLAVTDGMITRVGAERFIIPLTHIHMSFRPDRSMLSTIQGSGEVVVLRGEVMPLVRLHRLFDVPGAVESPLDALVMIVGDGDRRTALLVDELLGQQQVVAKALGAGLGNVPGISGGAILGDGQVGLILDVNETVRLARSGDAGRRERPTQSTAA